ncbi:MAG: hypothetical protein AAF497_28580 [Planctomycetota bacterium]
MRNRIQRHLKLESLEDKCLLAGDVTVSVVEGNLRIEGDAADNGVAITSGDTADSYIVAGLPSDDGTPTTINGATERVEVTGVTGNMRIGLGEGNDGLRMFNANVRGNVGINMGVGNDSVQIGGPVSTTRDVNSLIHGRVAVAMAEGRDSLRIDNAGIGRGMEAHGGDGNDSILVNRSRLRGTVSLATGQGDDNVGINDSRAAFVRIGTGDGADNVALVDSAFTAVGFNGGTGDDDLAISGIRARGVWFNGGEGEDRLRFEGPNRVGLVRITGFEIIEGVSGDGANALNDDLVGYEIDDATQIS